MQNSPMQNFPDNFDLDPEAAAFAYLMASTEALMKHRQRSFIESGPKCNTAGCLAGHAAVYELGSVPDALQFERALREKATQALFGYSGAGGFTNQFDRLFEDFVVCEMDEEQALRNFKRLVRVAATEEEWKKFQELISLDAKKLRNRSLVSAR